MELSVLEHVVAGGSSPGAAPTAGERRIVVDDPATATPVTTVPAAGTDDVDRAVAAARAAFETWRTSSTSRRAAVLFAFRDEVRAGRAELVAAISSEHGKTPADAAGELARGLEIVEFACGLPALLQGSFGDQVSTGVDCHSFREPLGVTVGITPFNFPAMVPLWMAPVAIAAGNAFVLKPSERVPTAANVIAGMWERAGLPPGVFSVLHGDRDTVDALLDHPDVQSISFVGSTPVARHVYERGTAAGKRVQALGGAKNHAVVMPDADLEEAADHLVAAGYGSAGQRCMAISVVVAVGEDARADALVQALAERASRIVVGPASDERSEMGPVISAASRDRVIGVVDDAEAGGARVVLDGRSLRVPGHEEGYFVGPTLLDHVDTASAAYTEEIFGPVLVVVRVATYEDAVALVNGGPYGNGAAIFTGSGALARRFTHDARAGMIGVNVPIPVPTGSFSFGGHKASLFGDTHVYGAEGLRFYTRAKVVTTRWPAPAPVAASLAFPNAESSR